MMLNAKGFFFFKFANEKGLMDVLESGPWMIRNNPIFLNKWTTNISVYKKIHTLVPVWFKIHDIPFAGFTEDGLSAIATKIGVLLC